MMQGPAAAHGWFYWRRNRLFLGPAAVYLAAVSIACRTMPLESSYHAASIFLGLPAAFGFIWLLGEFTYGKDFDLLSRESGFPTRLFSTPVSTRELVAWPMLYGCSSVAAGWLLINVLLIRPRGPQPPLLWPSLFAAVLMAWIQSISWTSFRYASWRIAVSVVGLGLIVVGVILAIRNALPKPLLLVGLGIQLPLAYLVAVRGVGQARCGDVPTPWRLPALERRGALARFGTPLQAQRDFEWRLNGKTLPIITLSGSVAILLLHWLIDRGRAPDLRLILFLYNTPLLGCFAASFSMSRFAMVQDIRPMSSFMATRPISTKALVGAKLMNTAKAIGVSYVIAALAAVVLCLTTDAGSVVSLAARRIAAEHSPGECVVLGTAFALGPPTFAWLIIANGLWLGLSGKRWVVVVYAFTMSVLLVAAFMIGTRFLDADGPGPRQLESLAWILGGAAVLKLLAVVAVAVAAMRRRLVSPSIAAAACIGWLTLASVCAGFAVWVAGSSPPIDRILLAAVLLALPVFGLPLAPLMLDWNRHAYSTRPFRGPRSAGTGRTAAVSTASRRHR